MSVFAEPLAQVREGLANARAIMRGLMTDPAVTRTTDLTPEIEECTEALAALDLIEQRAADMERVVRDWLPDMDSDMQQAFRAVLSTRKGAEVTPDDHANTEGRLILHIEVPGFNVEGAQDAADEFYDGDVFPIVIEEWMRGDVIVVATDIPGEKSQNHEFSIHALEGRIVDAEIARGGAR